MSNSSQAAAALLVSLNGNATQAVVITDAVVATVAPQSLADARARYEEAKVRCEAAKQAYDADLAAMETCKDTLVEVARGVSNAALEGTGLVTHIENSEVSTVRFVAGQCRTTPNSRGVGPIRRASGVRRAHPSPIPRSGSRSTRHTMVEGVAVYETAAAAAGPAMPPPRPSPLEDVGEGEGEAPPVAPGTPVDLKRALYAIDGARRSADGRFFKGPVPLDVYDDYLQHVEKPTDLFSIRGKLKAAAEITIGMIDDHLALMEHNAMAYSAAHPESNLGHVSTAARVIRAKMIYRLMQPVV
jgi:hypothetical protein